MNINSAVEEHLQTSTIVSKTQGELNTEKKIDLNLDFFDVSVKPVESDAKANPNDLADLFGIIPATPRGKQYFFLSSDVKIRDGATTTK